MFKRFKKRDLNKKPYTIYRPKPTVGGKELKPKPIKPKAFSKGGSIMKVPGGYAKEGSGRISDKGLKGRSPQQVFAEKDKVTNKSYGMQKKEKGGEMKKAGLNVGETLKQFKDLMTGSKDSKMSKQKENLKKQIAEGRAKMRDEAKVKYKDGGLTGGQKKLDVNNDGKISGEDFKILKGKQNKMRGGGIAIKGTNFKGVF